MDATPLQSMLQIDVLSRDTRTAVREHAGAVRAAGGVRGAPAQARGDRDDVPAAVGQRADRCRFALHPERAGRAEGRGRGVRAFPVRRDPAGARVRRLDHAPRQGPLLDHQQRPADAGVVVRGRDGGAVHRLRGAAAFDPDRPRRSSRRSSASRCRRLSATSSAACRFRWGGRSSRATGFAAARTWDRSRESHGARRRS